MKHRMRVEGEGDMDRFPAWVEIDLDAMKWNIDAIRGMIAPACRILLVVKADAGSPKLSEVKT